MNFAGRFPSRMSVVAVMLLLVAAVVAVAWPSVASAETLTSPAQTVPMPVSDFACSSKAQFRLPTSVCKRKFVLDVPANLQVTRGKYDNVLVTRTFGQCMMRWSLLSLDVHDVNFFKFITKHDDFAPRHKNGWFWHDPMYPVLAGPFNQRKLLGHSLTFGSLRTGKYYVWASIEAGIEPVQGEAGCEKVTGTELNADGIAAAKVWRANRDLITHIRQP